MLLLARVPNCRPTQMCQKIRNFLTKYRQCGFLVRVACSPDKVVCGPKSSLCLLTPQPHAGRFFITHNTLPPPQGLQGRRINWTSLTQVQNTTPGTCQSALLQPCCTAVYGPAKENSSEIEEKWFSHLLFLRKSAHQQDLLYQTR